MTSGSSPGRRLEVGVFLAVVAFTYLTMTRELESNVWARMGPVFSVVERGVLDIDPLIEQRKTGDWSKRGEHYYSNKAPGPMFLALPLYYVQHRIQRALGVPDDSPRAREVAAYVANAVVSVAPTLIATALLWTALVRRPGGSEGIAFGLAGAWTFGSLALPYSVIFFGHQTSAAFFAMAVCLVLLEGEREGGARTGRIALAGLCAGLAAISDYLSAALVAVWTALLAWRDARRLAPWIAGGAGPVLVCMAYNAACFGSPFTTAYDLRFLSPEFTAMATWEAPKLTRLLDVTVTPWRGIFYCTPVLGLMLVALDWFGKETRGRDEAAAAAAGVTIYFVLLAAFPSAWGGSCVGPRYFTSALPLCTLLLAPAARMLPRLFGALAALSGVMMLAAVLTDPLQGGQIRDPFRERIFPLLVGDGPVPMRNLFTNVLGLSRLVTFGIYLGLWGACALWLWLRLRRSGEAPTSRAAVTGSLPLAPDLPGGAPSS